MQQTTPSSSAPVHAGLGVPAKSAPVALQAQELKLVSGGSPRGGWLVATEMAAKSPRGGW